MSERAYSKELKRIMTASEAVDFSAKGELKDSRAFCCSDKKCGIDLTCTNWRNIKGKRKYFVPSSKEDLHVIGCDEVSQRDNTEQIGRETKEILSEVKKNGIIIMLTSPDRNTKENGNSEDVVDIARSKNGYIYKKNDEEKREKYEGRRAARVESFVELYHRNDVDHKKRIIRISGKTYSLDELFIPSTDELIEDEYRIFFGKALINTSFKSGMLEINFIESNLPAIYTNVNCLKKIGNGNKVKKRIDTNDSVMAYFRGRCKENKFESFNDRNYKDLYFELD